MRYTQKSKVYAAKRAAFLHEPIGHDIPRRSIKDIERLVKKFWSSKRVQEAVLADERRD